MRRLAACALALLLALPAQAGPGAHPFEFLSLDADARPVSLGGAYTALASDANALLYNPGGLGFVERNEAVFMHNQYFEGVSQEYASFAARRGWGAQLNYLSFGDVPKTTIANRTGAGLGSYGISDLALSGGYGRRFGGTWAVGGAVKYIRESIEAVTAQTMAFDAGALWRPAALPGAALGAALRNAGPDVKFQRASEKLPTQLRLGGAYTRSLRGQQTTLALDVTKKRLEDPVVAVGLETLALGRLPLRLGYDMRNDAGLGLSAGVGWVAPAFRFDYAFVSFGDLGSAHRVSAALRWGPSAGAEPKAPAPPDAGRAPMPEVSRHLWLTSHLGKAEAALMGGDLDAAARHLQEAEPLLQAGQPGQRTRWLVLRGRLAAVRSDLGTARADFEAALAAAEADGSNGPDVVDARLGLARCLAAEGRGTEAEAQLRAAFEAHPTDAQRRQLIEALRLKQGPGILTP
ncbi:MAG: PorV/PorQ family protein [Elusimicrobia bacterium]|nr:PorV/PorQ family protein [Elusimicrobiota bacterium]